MNRKSFLKSLGAIIAAPFVINVDALAAAKEKKVIKQTKVEQDTIKKFYTPPKTNIGYSGVYAVSGVYIPMSG